jgi:mannose-6-phosphate isomerase-like protein (cupin superfamily)
MSFKENTNMKAIFILSTAMFVGLALPPLGAVEPLASRIAHTDPSKYKPSTSVHGGAGELDFTALLDFHSLDTNLQFLHRGVIDPHSGIGHHFHNNCEEMFVILDGEAQFTVDGRTSLLKGPAGAPARMGHSHAIYNATDKPVQWMNINVSMLKGEYDNFDLNDKREDVSLDKTPVFITMSLDDAQLRNVNSFHGGKGTAQYRRALGPAVFATPWAFVDHIVLPAGASIGPHSYRGVAQFYYVMTGEGTVSLITRGQQETAAIRTGDAVPIQLSEVHSIENTGPQRLELMVVGVARDTHKEMEYVDASLAAPRRN